MRKMFREVSELEATKAHLYELKMAFKEKGIKGLLVYEGKAFLDSLFLRVKGIDNLLSYFMLQQDAFSFVEARNELSGERKERIYLGFRPVKKYELPRTNPFEIRPYAPGERPIPIG